MYKSGLCLLGNCSPVGFAQFGLSWDFFELSKADAVLRVGNVPLELRVHKSLKLLMKVQISSARFLSTEINLWLSPYYGLIVLSLQNQPLVLHCLTSRQQIYSTFP